MIDRRQHIIGKLIPYDFETITVNGTAIGLTASKLTADPPPKKVVITIESNQLRYRMDGTDPTSSVGHILSPADVLILEGYSQLNNAKFIRKGILNATLSVTYLR